MEWISTKFNMTDDRILHSNKFRMSSNPVNISDWQISSLITRRTLKSWSPLIPSGVFLLNVPYNMDHLFQVKTKVKPKSLYSWRSESQRVLASSPFWDPWSYFRSVGSDPYGFIQLSSLSVTTGRAGIRQSSCPKLSLHYTSVCIFFKQLQFTHIFLHKICIVSVHA